MSVQSTAEKIAAKLDKPEGNVQQVFIDPATIYIITNVVISLIKLYKACKKPADQAVTIAHYPFKSDIRKVKLAVRRELGWRRYFSEGQDYVNAVLEHGKTLNQEEMQELYNDSQTCEYPR